MYIVCSCSHLCSERALLFTFFFFLSWAEHVFCCAVLFLVVDIHCLDILGVGVGLGRVEGWTG